MLIKGEIERASKFFWNNDVVPLLATGTISGAVDDNFNSFSFLEIWDLFSSKRSYKEPIISLTLDQKFNSITWSNKFENYSEGVLVGAMDSGEIFFWNVADLMNSKNDNNSLIFKSNKFNNEIKSLNFNPIDKNIMVASGSDGFFYIWDLFSVQNPISIGSSSLNTKTITCASWNNSISHIIATTYQNSNLSIWDSNNKKEVLNLSYPINSKNLNFSQVVWHPEKSTKLITASDDDENPLILGWDLRNSSVPEVIIKGHSKGILSVDWCKQDSDLLISSGKDNNVMLWNPSIGELLASYPTSNNWIFQTSFTNNAPDYFASASYDGKIFVQSIHDACQKSPEIKFNNEKTFWNQISGLNINENNGKNLKQSSKWLKNPISISFGFGSQFVSVKKTDDVSTIKIQKLPFKSKVLAKEMIDAMNNNDYILIFKIKFRSDFFSKVNEFDWMILKRLDSHGKNKLIDFEKQENTINNANENNEFESEKSTNIKENENLNFESLISSIKFQKTEESDVDNNFNQSSISFFKNKSEDDKELIDLILSKDIENSILKCLQHDRLIEALVLSLNASDEIKNKVKNYYFNKNNDSDLARIINAVSTKDITDIVNNAEISDWKIIVKCIHLFSNDEHDFNSKMVLLGDRLSLLKGIDNQRDNAVYCYLMGDSIDKLFSIWFDELHDHQKIISQKNDLTMTFFDTYFEALSNFIQKVMSCVLIMKKELKNTKLLEKVDQSFLEFSDLTYALGETELSNKILNFFSNYSVLLHKSTKTSGIDNLSSNNGFSQNYLTNEKLKLINNSSIIQAQNILTNTPLNKLTTAKNSDNNNQNSQNKSFSTIDFLSKNNNINDRLSIKSDLALNDYNPNNSAKSVSQLNKNNVSSVYVPLSSNNTNTTSFPYSKTQAEYSQTLEKPYKFEKEGWNDIPDLFKLNTKSKRPVAIVNSSNNYQYSLTPKLQPSGTNLPPPPKTRSTTNLKISDNVTSNVNLPLQSLEQSNDGYLQSNKFFPITDNQHEQNPVYLTISSIQNFQKKNLYSSRSDFTSNDSCLNKKKISQANSNNQQLNYSQESKQNFNDKDENIIHSKIIGILPPKTSGIMNSVSHNVSLQPSSHIQKNNLLPPSLDNKYKGQMKNKVNHSTQNKKFPDGDRSHIPEKSIKIYKSLSTIYDSIKFQIPEKYSKHAQDMEKRLNILFDHLNNDDFLSDEVIDLLNKVCLFLEAKDFTSAATINIEIATKHSKEIGNWHIGVKRLITMSEVIF